MMLRRTRLRGPAAVALVATIAATGALAPGTAAAKRNLGRHWGGSTSQASPLSFALARSGKSVAEAHLFVTGRCDDGAELNYYGTARFSPHAPGSLATDGDHVLVGGKLSRTGKFNAHGTWSASFGAAVTGRITETVDGRVTRKGAGSGTLRATVQLVDGAGTTLARCDSGALTWHASSARGRVYAGVSTTDQPVVVEIDRRGTKVRHMRFGWDAPCVPSDTGSWLMPEDFTGLELAGGAFSFDLPLVFGYPDGSRRSVQYSLAGRVRKATANGTVSVKVADTDAAGAPESTCDTGTVGWTARSG
jgi:hypothetical protein